MTSVFSREESVVVETSAEFKGDLVWNKWDTENFIVLSLDKSQGLQIKDVVEDLRSVFLDSWGFNDDKSLVPCKLICVPDKATLSKLFNIDSPRYEVRYDSEGKASSCAIWLDQGSLDSLSFLVGAISVSRSVLPHKVNPAIQKGIQALSRSTEHSRNLLKSSSKVDARSVFSPTLDPKSKTTPQDSDLNCALVCLLLRKEFGREAFSSFVNGTQDESSIKKVFGFGSFDELSKTLDRYSSNLSSDISSNRTPDEYLIPNSSY